MTQNTAATEVVKEALRLVQTAVDAAQEFRVAAVAAKFGDEIRPTPDLVAAVNKLFASLPPVKAVEQLQWVAAQLAAPQTNPQEKAVRKALTPFLDYFDKVEQAGEGENFDSDAIIDGYRARITFGDFRALKAAISPQAEGHTKENGA